MKNIIAFLLVFTLPTFAQTATPPVDSAFPDTSKPKIPLTHPIVEKEHSGNGRLGIRLEFIKGTGYPRIVGLTDGGPAHDAGLKFGDIILQIDKNNTLAMTEDQVKLSLHGDPDTGVELVIQRNDDPKPITLAIKRRLLAPDQIETVRPVMPGVFYNPSPAESPLPYY